MATQVSGAGGTTASFSNAPQAQGDFYSFTEDNAIATNVLALNVMSNDLGGAAKSLYSIDNGISSNGVYYKGGADADLLTKDGVTTYDTSLDGAHIYIQNGQVMYDVSTLPYNLDSLAAGQTHQDSFVYAIQLGNGTLSWSTVTLTFTGQNDAPVISGHSDGGVTEDTGADTSGNLNASGTVTYTDVDTIDTHTASFQQQSTDTSHLGVFSLDQTSIDTGNGGAVGWSFQVADDAVDYLGEGQTLTQHYDVTVKDNNGATAVQTITVTITGTNEAPTATAATINLTETSSTDAGTQVSSGNALTAVQAADVDNGDTPYVSLIGSTAVPSNGSSVTVHGTYGDLTIAKDGAYSYTANAAYDALNTGQTGTDTFNFTVSDGHVGGDTATSLTFSIAGTNDKVLGPVSFNFAVDVGNLSNLESSNSLHAPQSMGNITAVDSGGDAFTYALGSGSDGAHTYDTADFAISSTGALSTVSTAGNGGNIHSGTYYLDVIASSGGQSVSQEFIVWVGGNGADSTSFTGSSTPVIAYGLNANDTVGGGSSGSFIAGGNGNDVLSALSGTLVGEAGADTLTHLTGTGAGAMTFSYAAASESSATYKPNGTINSEGRDTINGFVSGTDKIDLTALGTHLAVEGLLSAATTTVNADSIAWKVNGSNLELYVNVSGSSETITEGSTYNADMQIHLHGITSISASDLLFLV